MLAPLRTEACTMACARAHRGCGGMRGGSGRRTLHRSNYNNSFPADRHLDVDVGTYM